MMWRSTGIVLALVVSAIGSISNGVRRDQFTNLQQRLNDHSWTMGKSSLVGVGASTCSSVFSCADCNTAQVCRPTTKGTFVPVRNITCPASAPFCQYSTGTCGVLPDDSCGQTDNFICLADGHYPDANCSVYHVCEGLVAHKFECKITGETYNADSASCEAASGCAAFNCDGTGKKVASSLYPSYYAYCTNNAQLPLVIDRCTGINQLNATSQVCEPICQEEGAIQDVEDCTKYYKCSYLWINDSTKFMIRERLDCPTNTGFDPNNYICINLTQYPGCSPGVPVSQLHPLHKLEL